MSQPLRVRRLTDQEGRELQRIVRRGGGKTEGSVVRWRRASVVLASAGGNTVPVIARLAATSRDRVREVIHRFNDDGMASLDPRWAGGRPRRITTEDEDFIVAAATKRPEALGLPFTRWSLRELAAYLGDNQTRVVKISAERLRQILAARGVTFQRTKTWKESNDPERDAKLDRIEEVLGAFPRRCYAFDEFGPLQIRPVAGAGWALAGRPPRIAANYHKAHGVRQFHGCYSIGGDTLWGVVRQRKSAANTLAALKSIRARHSDGERIYVILDNLSAHKGPLRAPVGTRQQSRAVLHPDLQLLGQPDEAHFGPLREFVLNNSQHPNHTVLTRRLHAYLRWRNANARDPDLLAAHRRERARTRAEKGHRWGRPLPQAA